MAQYKLGCQAIAHPCEAVSTQSRISIEAGGSTHSVFMLAVTSLLPVMFRTPSSESASSAAHAVSFLFAVRAYFLRFY